MRGSQRPHDPVLGATYTVTWRIVDEVLRRGRGSTDTTSTYYLRPSPVSKPGPSVGPDGRDVTRRSSCVRTNSDDATSDSVSTPGPGRHP